MTLTSSTSSHQRIDTEKFRLRTFVEKLRAIGGPALAPQAADLRAAEWQLLSRPTTERQDADFRATPTLSPPGYDRLLDQVVLVRRLREVREAIEGWVKLAVK